MFARVKPLGWAYLEILEPDEITQLDINMSRAIDGVGGGDYTNTSEIILRGSVQLPNLFSAQITNLSRNNGATGWPLFYSFAGGTDNRTIDPGSPIYVALCNESVGPSVQWTISTEHAIDGNVFIVSRAGMTSGYDIELVRANSAIIHSVPTQAWAMLCYSTTSGWTPVAWGLNTYAPPESGS